MLAGLEPRDVLAGVADLKDQFAAGDNALQSDATVGERPCTQVAPVAVEQVECHVDRAATRRLLGLAHAANRIVSGAIRRRSPPRRRGRACAPTASRGST